jgi:preprotein translocase subunit YajC
MQDFNNKSKLAWTQMSVLFSTLTAILLIGSESFAQAAHGAKQPSIIEIMILPFVVIMGVFWIFIIRPQTKKQNEHRVYLNSLKRGDEVITSSGILGKIEGLTELYVTLEIADGVRIKLLRSQISGSQQQLNNN